MVLRGPRRSNAPGLPDMVVCDRLKGLPAVESINARYRRVIRTCDHFPTEQAEAGAQRVGDHLQRPDHPGRQLTDAKVRSAVYQAVPNPPARLSVGEWGFGK